MHKRLGETNIGVNRNKSIKYNLASLITIVRGLEPEVITVCFSLWEKGYNKRQILA